MSENDAHALLFSICFVYRDDPFIPSLSAYIHLSTGGCMSRSMTAYGRASRETVFGHLTIEISSVNSKSLDLTLLMPKEWACYEIDIRRWVAAVLSRGHCTIRIQPSYSRLTPIQVTPNIPLAQELKKAWDAIGSALHISSNAHFHLEMLAHESELFHYHNALHDDATYKEALSTVIHKALTRLVAMREVEGNTLTKGMFDVLTRVRERIEATAAATQLTPERYRERLLQLLQESLPEMADHQERIFREVLLLADRIDITEEITRAYSHLDQIHYELRKESGQIGKKLDFLFQELLREINTMASKSPDLAITRAAIENKNDIEILREQARNLE